MVAALAVQACGSADEPDPGGAAALPAIADSYDAVGATDAATVVVLAQGGPLSQLVPAPELRSMLGVPDLERVLLVNVHQAQTIDPRAFGARDLSFAEAVAASARSVEIFAAVVDHFRERGRTVYVVGISFGAYVVQELLATQGNQAAGYLIISGRLDMPEAIWTEFAEARTPGFVDGVEIVARPHAGGGDAADAVFQRNSARLAAGLGHHRYTERLAQVELANVVYVYARLDEQVGRLTEPELAFLRERGAEVIEYDGDHATPDPVMRDAFSRLFHPE